MILILIKWGDVFRTERMQGKKCDCTMNSVQNSEEVS
jgi:hypothetical protein